MHGVGGRTPEEVARDVLDNLHEGCQVVGFDYRYLYVNDALVRQSRTTREALLGRTMSECYPGIEHTELFERVRGCMHTRMHDRMENELTFPDGSKAWFELRFVPVSEGTCVLSLEITEAKRAAAALARSEAQLRHAQKMEAVGRLAGGIAHDFNNMLSVVLSYACLLIEGLPEGNPMREDLEQIKLAAERSANLTRQLLAFSRHQLPEPRILALDEVVAGMQKMIGRLVGDDVVVDVVPPSMPLGKVKVDPSHVEQVLVNLVANARDAMPGGGTITIETCDIELDELFAGQHLGVAPGPYVMLSVRDSGVGMDKQTLERVFEPFFTTKAAGSGRGLGLATVFGIVRQNGGSIWAHSEPGRGSTFEVFFPRTDEVEQVRPSRRPVATLHGTETILLAEDDDALRAVTAGVLARGGYDVVAARDGAEALELARRHEGRFDLLLTDVVMPVMGGSELVRRLLPERPDTRVLYMSGYTDDAVLQHDLHRGDVTLLQKPITPESLLRKVREVLDAGKSS